MDHLDEILTRARETLATKKPCDLAPTKPSSPDCADCGDARFVRGPNGVVPCRCQTAHLSAERMAWMLKFCDLPACSDEFTFETWKHNPKFIQLEETFGWMKDFGTKGTAENGGWITLVGHGDLGKSHLAMAACREWLKRGIPARFVSVPLMLDKLRSGYAQKGDASFDSQMENLLTVPLLVLDDIGRRATAVDWAMEKLETIIDYRSMNRLALIITSNHSLEQTSKLIASRVYRYPKSTYVYLVPETPEFRLRKEKK
jgi:DNA replication protein DnaC